MGSHLAVAEHARGVAPIDFGLSTGGHDATFSDFGLLLPHRAAWARILARGKLPANPNFTEVTVSLTRAYAHPNSFVGLQLSHVCRINHGLSL